MSAKSWLGTIWRRIRHPSGFVGQDLQGNSYYERANPLNGAGYSRPKRSVKYRRPDDMWNYIGGSKRLPIQWSAWLAHTRANPPTIQELQVDLLRQQRVQQSAALIEETFQQERAQMRLLESTTSDVPTPPAVKNQGPSTTALESSVPSQSPENTPPTSETRQSASSLPKTGTDDYRPESWTPKFGVRRGG
ncbi:hypothetical protein GYMLUDRAFT_35970 [Collybiopsis luxurians FD-317 M1]|nr:hypothetical protein GYMLUDRAFT_35970 [Collybiopsis luxurians FD-317 M1]